jgi:hypothetical protein
MNTTSRPTKSSRISSMFQESVLHFLLLAAIVGAVVDRGIAMSGGTII